MTVDSRHVELDMGKHLRCLTTLLFHAFSATPTHPRTDVGSGHISPYLQPLHAAPIVVLAIVSFTIIL